MLKNSFKPNVTTPKNIKKPYAIFIKKQFAAKKKTIDTEGLHGS